MTRRPFVVALALLAELCFAAPATSTADRLDHEHHHHDEDQHLTLSHLVALWLRTAKYHDIDTALASGRVDLGLCFDQMGEHFTDPSTFADGVVDPLGPEALVYEHVGDRLRLVAVEWVATTPADMAGIPLHLNEVLGVYVLHAWIWSFNPDVMLADHNLNVGNCPTTAGESPPQTLLEVSVPATCSTAEPPLRDWSRSTDWTTAGSVSFACPATPDCDGDVTVRATGSTDPDGDIAMWSIDFDDGTSTGGAWPPAPAEVTHHWPDGLYDVRLTVTDAGGRSSTDTTTLSIDTDGAD